VGLGVSRPRDRTRRESAADRRTAERPDLTLSENSLPDSAAASTMIVRPRHIDRDRQSVSRRFFSFLWFFLAAPFFCLGVRVSVC